jgi:pyruvate,orthophosphate dikinase
MGVKKYIYLFGGGDAEGSADMKELLGGKGANLAEMARLGLPVPPGFTITTEVCRIFYELGEKFPDGLEEGVREAMKHIERIVRRKFGDAENPLLVSVRSGAPVSMPGMMDTILNLGLNDETVNGLIRQSGNERFAWDAYRRFVQMFGDVVLGLKPEGKDEIDPFEEILEEKKKEKGVSLDTELDADDMKDLVYRFKQLIKDRKGIDFPEDAWEQLWLAISAVFKSWNNPRAIKYREINNIPPHWGTAVNVVAMVFGNMGDDSATGVAFTRDPSTGEKRFFGEYLINAQGEDVVAGIRTPFQITLEGSREWAKSNGIDEDTRRTKYPSLEEYMPNVFKELVEVYKKLEGHYRDMQDIEFTIEKGKLWLLQTRTGKRTARAAVRIAVDMVDEGLISEEEALLRVKPEDLNQLLHPIFDPKVKKEIIAKGLPASPGAATGKVVFNAEDAERLAKEKEDVILVRIETSPEDIGGMNSARGVLTARGGKTSHAAVVARGMGKPCVVGCGDIEIDYAKREFRVKGTDVVVKEGDWLSIDGATGDVMLGKVPTIEPEISGYFGRFMEWADKHRRLGVRTNADTPRDSAVARNFGAEGIGLCRTEHMFFEGDRIKAMREMILAKTTDEREKALSKILPMQREDFYEIFKVMEGLPVTIRLLDPPLHEFLPKEEEDIKELADELGVSVEDIKSKVEELQEFNPMLGHRGCRLGISYPEITMMQARAILEAACKMKKEGKDVCPEIMVPLVGNEKELEHQKKVIDKVANEVFEREGVKVNYKVGTMIEVPRACVVADRIANVAEFFSFGTNDLTQMGCGFSRDDAGKFLPMYVSLGIYEKDPFQSLDKDGVGELMKIAISKGRSARKDLKLGICGEHGGDPDSIEFCHNVGLDYVSCSPYRVPIARLAAAQAAIKEKMAKQGKSSS